MSFKEFVQSHTGRRFFDSFDKFVSLLEKLVGTLDEFNKTMGATPDPGEPVPQDAIGVPINTPLNVPVSMPCISCQEETTIENSVGITFRGETALMCANCAIERGIISELQPAN